MERLKQTYKEKLLNEDLMLKSIHDSIEPKSSFRMNFKFKLMVGALAALILFLVISNLDSIGTSKSTNIIGITTPRNNLAYALVSVDINPSFELYVDKDDKVIEINPINDDAKTLDTESLINLEVQDAIEELIKQAQNLGYINITDTNQDTVIISTINYGIDGEKLVKNIQVKLKSSLDINRNIKSYIIQATDDDREKAKEENISLGIFMLNGIIQNNGVPMSIQAFVSDINNLEILEEYAEKTNGTELVEVIQVLIDELKRLGFDTTRFQTRLNTDGEDLEELVEDLKDEFEYQNKGTSSKVKEDDRDDLDEDHNKIDDHEDDEVDDYEEKDND